jgi:hypothetical protein
MKVLDQVETGSDIPPSFTLLGKFRSAFMSFKEILRRKKKLLKHLAIN